ncbi:tolloid-like protein 1 [Daphnia carinata]|uniref:tolloid-like protein 1 n=1 Tax=Daphnia carinata TaxID=120202 RepID=UPI00257B2B66|nr:tolloid-like protein 1 [Daphnia carinata]
MILFALFQATLVLELFVFLFFFFPTIVVYESLTSRLSKSNALGSSIGSCTVDDNCGVCKDMTKEGGTIEPPNFPNEYSSDLNCVYKIESPTDTMIELTFTEFIVENCCDFITVFDGESDPLKIALNGYDIPEAITSTANKMTIKFTTNGDNTMILPANLSPGRWQAKYKFLAIESRITVPLENATLAKL